MDGPGRKGAGGKRPNGAGDLSIGEFDDQPQNDSWVAGT